jgi:anaerobic selenocysteine-containing dehydrogenase
MVNTFMKVKKEDVWQDEWIPTVCSMCLHHCGILVHVVNGVALSVAPDPQDPDSEGHICAKAQGMIQQQYNKYRLLKPVMRTNSEKGLGVDPKWKEITWDEAWSIIVEKFKKILNEDPRKLIYAGNDFRRSWIWGWGEAVFGTPNGFFSDVGTTCGGGYHPVNGIMFGSFAQQPDWYHCNYLIQIGGGDGFETHLHLAGNAKRAADARMRGMKVVSIDPRFSNTSIKADRWIPIRPGTDGAFVQAMMHVMVVELDKYDKEFLKKRTNAVYLIGPHGYYVRDKATRKPLVWDPVDKTAKPFDDPTIKDYALLGEYNVDAIECIPKLDGNYKIDSGQNCDGEVFEGKMTAKPAFQLFYEIIREYTPEWAEKITSVPASVIREIAKEFVEAARIGDTIVIDGVEYPYRPACINWYRGAHAHEHSFLDNFTFKLANLLIGNFDVPGGLLNVPLGWDPHIDAWSAEKLGWVGPSYNYVEPDEDGVVKPWLYELRPPTKFKYPPDFLDLLDYLPIAVEPGHLYSEAILNPEKFGVTYKPEAALIIHANPVWNSPNSFKTVEAIKKLDLVVAVDVSTATSETTSLADIVLPDTTYLESWGIEHCEAPFIWGFKLRRPVLKPPDSVMDATDFLTELSDRLGILHKWNGFLNARYIEPFGKPELLLEPNRKYKVEEFLDRWVRAEHGVGLDWFLKNKWNVRKKTPKELYWPYGNVRVPFYMMIVKKYGDELRKKFSEIGYPKDWMRNWADDYLPLPVWKPSNILSKDDEYDMTMIYYKLPQVTFGDMTSGMWTSPVLQMRPDVVGVLINSRTAEKKGIKDGDTIIIESKNGVKVRATAHVTPGVHPEVIGVSNAGKMVLNENAITYAPMSSTLLEGGLEHTDKASGAPETAVRVKVSMGMPRRPQSGSR